MKKILVLYETDKENYVYKEWKKNEINVEIMFYPINKFLRGIRKIWFKYNLPLKQIWYNKWKQEVNEIDIVIIDITYLSLRLGEFIKKINKNVKVIGWYWNNIDKKTLPTNVKGCDEIWSFDPEDCKKYNLRFNHQYYFKTFIISKEKEIYDLYFCGEDAGRGKKILEVYNKCKNLNTKFEVVKPMYDKLPEKIKSKRVDYDLIRKNISKSKAILEILKEGQSGPTLRTMEAIYFNKKLITNNLNIKEEEFYNENNIYVLEDDNKQKIEEFLKKKFIPYDIKLLDKYDVSNWLKAFMQD